MSRLGTDCAWLTVVSINSSFGDTVIVCIMPFGKTLGASMQTVMLFPVESYRIEQVTYARLFGLLLSRC